MAVPTLPPALSGRLRARLLDWFAVEKRALPWREDRDPYRVWISEAMLQQTRVETVIGYFERFLERFPTVAHLAQASEEDVLGMWSGLGYYSRARKLRAAAGVIVEEFGGEFPRSREEALSLPGVGPYTAGAVLSIAYALPEPLVDGNVQRVFARLFALSEEAGSGPLQKKLWALATELVPMDGGAGDWNQALMELGATLCTQRNPACERCPLASSCRALELGRVSELPRPKPRKRPTEVELEIYVVRRGQEVLLEQRPQEGRMASLWQFPTVECAPGAELFPAELAGGADPLERGRPIGKLRHSITRYSIQARLHEARVRGETPAGWRWFATEELEDAALTGMTRKVLATGSDSEPGACATDSDFSVGLPESPDCVARTPK